MTETRKAPFEVEIVVDGHDTVGEGPVWLAEERRLVWVDIMGHLIHRLDPATGSVETVDVGQPVGAVAPRASGGLIAAVRDGFGLVDAVAGRLEMIAEVEADNPENRMNDGKCDRAGRFWAGTMAFESVTGAGALYRLDAERRVTEVLDNVTISNGLDWSPDDATLYYVDSPTNVVDAFDYDPGSGEIRNRRPLIEVPREQGMPDGLTVDSEGFLWVALFGGWSVRRYAPDGTPDIMVELPASKITCPTFGGEDLSELYITSATEELSEQELQEQLHAGALFRCRPGVTGKPANAFGG